MPRITVELNCAICLNDEQSQDWTSLISCGHIFHEPCIRKWTNSKQPTPSGERTKKPDWCPLCRAKIQRPISNKGNTRENSRFRKLVFQGDIRTDLSSSPVRLHQGIGNDVAGIGSKRGKKALIVRGSSSEDEEIMLEEDNEESTRRRAMLSAAQRREGAEEAGTVLTESESDEENARPARPVYPRLNSASAAAGPSTTGQINNETTDNSGVNTLGEARATITLKNTQINTLREQLATSADQLTLANEARKEAIEEKEVVENRLVEKCEELRKIMEEARKAKEEKKALSRTLRSEVERVGELNRTNRKLIEELTVLKDKHRVLERQYEELNTSYNSTIEDYTLRLNTAESSEKTSRDRFQRIHDLNKMNQRKLDLKRERIRALESELARYKEAEENRRKDKGKERAIDQDNLNEQDAGISNNYMAPAATHAQPRRRQSTNKSNISIDDTSYMAQLPEEDLEESLFVTEIPDSEEGGGGSHEVVMLDDDGDDFADLDLVLSGTKPGRYSSTAAAGKLSRHPLKEWTNTGNVSNKRPASQAKESASSSVSFKDMNNKKRNLTSISSASEKWADMALFGTGIGSGGSSGKGNKSTRSGSKLQLATGEKKKARIRF